MTYFQSTPVASKWTLSHTCERCVHCTLRCKGEIYSTPPVWPRTKLPVFPLPALSTCGRSQRRPAFQMDVQVCMGLSLESIAGEQGFLNYGLGEDLKRHSLKTLGTLKLPSSDSDQFRCTIIFRVSQVWVPHTQINFWVLRWKRLRTPAVQVSDLIEAQSSWNGSTSWEPHDMYRYIPMVKLKLL